MKFEMGYKYSKVTNKWDLRVADDGTTWREATPKELADAPDDTLVWFGKAGTEPTPKSGYSNLYLAGNYPYLIGIAALLPVYVRAE